MTYPVIPPVKSIYGPDDFEQLMVNDFRGGLNITDPVIALPPNQFTTMLNFYYNRLGTIESRPPFRPFPFSTNIADRPCKVGYSQLITLFADGGDGEVDATCVGHGLITGDIVVISGTANYNGTFVVEKQTDDIFEFTDTWVADEADADSVFTVEFKPSTSHDYKVFRETLSNGWSYSDEVHVVYGVFSASGGSMANRYIVAVFNSSDNQWTIIWSALASATSAMSVVPYKINKAFDLLLFPNDTNPSRWSPSSTTLYGVIVGAVTDLGLAKPSDPHLNINDITAANPAVITTASAHGLATGDYVIPRGVAVDMDGMNGNAYAVTVLTTTTFSIPYSTAGNTYTAADDYLDMMLIPVAGAATVDQQGIDFNGTYTYTCAYFYDDSNSTTKYGESSPGVDHSVLISGCDKSDNKTVQVTIGPFPFPTGVTKVIVFRSPPNESSGPFKKVGEILTTNTAWIDNTPVGQEGVEPLPAGTNPSLSGSPLSVLKVRTVGPYLVGFNASMPHKLIWSVSGCPDVWNPLNYDYLDVAGVRAIEFNRNIYIFTKSSCYQKTDMDTTAVKISKIGCTDDRTLQDVGNGLMWLDHDTAYFADYITQYGSKGDFPLDVGHPISDSIGRRDSSATANSAFFERRYYLTYTDSEDSLSRTYVYDVDIKGWTQHSARHSAWSRGNTKIYSLGPTLISKSITTIDGTVDSGANALMTCVAHGLTDGDYITISGTTNYNGTYRITWVSVDTFKIVDSSQDASETGTFTTTKHYVFEHNYSASVAIVAGFSDYEGKDFHDYGNVAQTTYHGIATITASIGRENNRLAGDYRKAFVSSLSVQAKGSVVSILATISGEDDEFEVSKTFAMGSTPEVINTFAMVFGIDGDGITNNVFAADPDTAAAGDADEAGFAGLAGTSLINVSMHKKIKRTIKSRAVGLTLTSTDSRRLSILYIVIYWKPLPAIA